MSRRLIKAADIQPDDDPALVLARKRERTIKVAILTALGQIGDLFKREEIIILLRRYDVRAVLAVLESQEAKDAILTGWAPIADTFTQSMRDEVGRVNAQMMIAGPPPVAGLLPAPGSFSAGAAAGGAGGGSGGSGSGGGGPRAPNGAGDGGGGATPGGAPRLLLTYDPLTVIPELQTMRDDLAQTLTSGARSAVENALRDSIRSGISTELIAQRIRAVVGLDNQQQRAVANYRAALENGDSTALRRALRDQKYDELVRRAARGNTSLSTEKVDEMVAAYIKRSLDHRAQTIASTESMQASVSGIRTAYTKAVANGRLKDSEVTRFWLTAQNELVCPICASIPTLNPDGVGVNEDYESLQGPINAPLAHPRCQCSERYKTNFSRVAVQPFAQAA